ncbi:hypothetical protein AX17_000158 [Amanita inopinata Kibby_2008]|nr:hypothetical protein AX17_000158 [Amanita inopinata Kibby_2008]
MPQPCFYAVNKGRKPGVFLNWEECEAQIKNYPGAKYKKFTNSVEAEQFAKGQSAIVESTSLLQSNPVGPKTPIALPSDQNRTKKRRLSPDIADESSWDVVYSDGACKGNGKSGSLAGIGVWWGPNDSRNISERCPGEQTNNRAELLAISRVLETTPMTKTPLLIKTDSQYSINCFKSWLRAWEKNNFRTAQGQPVKNLGIILYISALLDARACFGQRLRLQYVKGHAGITGNEGADALATHGALLPQVADKNWDALRDKVLLDMSASKSLGVQPMEVVGPEPDTDDGSGKARRVNSSGDGVSGQEGQANLATSHISGTHMQSKVIMSSTENNSKEPCRLGNTVAQPGVTAVTSVVVNPRDIDYSLYADCVVNDEELWRDLEN